MSLAPGTSIGHYDVTSLLGEGGMGQVWQATDTQLNRQVVLKILSTTEDLLRFAGGTSMLVMLPDTQVAIVGLINLSGANIGIVRDVLTLFAQAVSARYHSRASSLR